jgi:hypothetical protein
MEDLIKKKLQGQYIQRTTPTYTCLALLFMCTRTRIKS